MARGQGKGRSAQRGVQAIFSEEDDSKSRRLTRAGIVVTSAALCFATLIVLERVTSLSARIAASLLLLGGTFYACSLTFRRNRPRRYRLSSEPYELEGEVEPKIFSPRLKMSRGEEARPAPRKSSSLRLSRVLTIILISTVFLTAFATLEAMSLHSRKENPLPTSVGTGAKAVNATKAVAGTLVNSGAIQIATPAFSGLSKAPEAIVASGRNYQGTTSVNPGELVVVQVAYSAGSGGNLPDISSVNDSQSNTYTKRASASPGAQDNFWEQAWTASAISSVANMTVTVSPDWLGCQRLCVSSVLMIMKVARYTGVAGIAAYATTMPVNSSTSQTVTITTTQSNSLLIELLSHGATNDCSIDAPQPLSGQTQRDCYTGTTERTEFFDRPTITPRAYSESYAWARLEVQRGICLELKGIAISKSP